MISSCVVWSNLNEIEDIDTQDAEQAKSCGFKEEFCMNKV